MLVQPPEMPAGSVRGCWEGSVRDTDTSAERPGCGSRLCPAGAMGGEHGAARISETGVMAKGVYLCPGRPHQVTTNILA